MHNRVCSPTPNNAFSLGICIDTKQPWYKILFAVLLLTRDRDHAQITCNIIQWWVFLWCSEDPCKLRYNAPPGQLQHVPHTHNPCPHYNFRIYVICNFSVLLYLHNPPQSCLRLANKSLKLVLILRIVIEEDPTQKAQVTSLLWTKVATDGSTDKRQAMELTWQLMDLQINNM